MHGMLLPFLRLQYLTEGVVVLGGGGMYVEHYPAYHQVRLSSAIEESVMYEDHFPIRDLLKQVPCPKVCIRQKLKCI